jgi:two-component system, cell cycle sensor histidine kinase and response regulator CckA
LLAGENIPTYEGQFRAKDGRLVTVELNVELVRDGDDRPLHVQSVARDITERIQAEAKTAQYQRELNEIHRIGVIANSTLDLNVTLNLILENVMKLMSVSVGMIFLKETDSDYLIWGASLGLSAEFVKAYQETPIRIGEGLTGTIAQTREPIFIAENSSRDPRVARSVVYQEGLNSFLGVPILAGDEVVGVMNLLTRPPTLLNEHDVHICAAIGSQTGLAISNARLYAAQEKARASLRDSEARLRSYITHAPYGLFVADENGRYLELNPVACAVTGYDEAELLTMTTSELLLPAAQEAGRTHFQQVQETGFAVGEFPFRHKSGETRYWRVSAVKLSPTRFIAFKEDITKRKLAEREIRKYKTILDNALHGAAIAHLDGTMLYVNDYFAQTHGYAAADLVGQYLSILHNEAQLPAVQALLQQMITTGYFFTTEVWHRRKDGSEFPMLMSGVLIKGEGDNGDYIAATAVDISDRKQAEESLRQSHAELAAALQALQDAQAQLVQQERLAAVGQLAAGVAHDFNNILAAIILYAQLMQQPISPQWAQEGLETIETQAKTGARLVEQILDFSRRSMLEKGTLDWLPILKEQIRLLVHTLPENIKLSFTAAQPANYIIHADATRLQQVLLNLALNGRDAMPNGGELRITLDKLDLTEPQGKLTVGSWLQLCVSDTGQGIPEKDRPYIFEPFFTTKPPGKGSGLGLSQVQGIVMQHGGQIEFVTAVNQGTTFTIYLPAIAQKMPAAPAEIEVAHGQQETILVVEDNEAVRLALIASLELLNYQVVAVENGRDALDYLAQQSSSIDLILSDMIMPIMGGAELFQHIRQQPLPIPMVLITGHQMDKKLNELMAQGLSGWIAKPLELGKLGHLVGKALQDSSRINRNLFRL